MNIKQIKKDDGEILNYTYDHRDIYIFIMAFNIIILALWVPYIGSILGWILFSILLGGLSAFLGLFNKKTTVSINITEMTFIKNETGRITKKSTTVNIPIKNIVNIKINFNNEANHLLVWLKNSKTVRVYEASGYRKLKKMAIKIGSYLEKVL